MVALTKREIAEAVSDELGFSIHVSLELVNEVFDQIKNSLFNGDQVKIVRFGSLRPVRKAARRGTNPSNGEPLIIPPKRTVAFRPSRLLKGIVNARKGEEILPDRRGKQVGRG
jgi:integration host factor subunit alpha